MPCIVLVPKQESPDLHDAEKTGSVEISMFVPNSCIQNSVGSHRRHILSILLWNLPTDDCSVQTAAEDYRLPSETTWTTCRSFVSWKATIYLLRPKLYANREESFTEASIRTSTNCRQRS